MEKLKQIDLDAERAKVRDIMVDLGFTVARYEQGNPSVF